MATEIDLYEILEISRDATKTEVKKAYHKAARVHHPDKVPEADRAAADERFKDIQQAYEILSDDQNRELYDQHGMAAFEKGQGGFPGGAGGPDLDDILAQMFGQGMGGMGGGFEGMGGMPGMGGMGGRGPRKSKNEVQEYEVSLEELYKGKTTRFASTKNVICQNCNGSGGKANAKPKKCGTCDGKGKTSSLHLFTAQDVLLTCSHRLKNRPSPHRPRPRNPRICPLLHLLRPRLLLQRRQEMQKMQRRTHNLPAQDPRTLHPARLAPGRQDRVGRRSGPSP